MEFLEHPSKEKWQERQEWFEDIARKYEEKGSYLVSEQACALIGEVQTAFCAGAWVAVLVLSLSVVDAQLRETELVNFQGNTQKLLEVTNANPDLQELRQRRNRIIHLNIDQPAITVDDQWFKRQELQEEAKKAVLLMFEAFFMSPGT